MSATTTERSTIRKGEEGHLDCLPLTNQKCLAGTIAVVNAAGYLAMGTAALNLKARGRFEETVDNSAGSAGDKRAEVLSGRFWWANATAGDLITIADVMNDCYILDNQTVAKTDGTGARSRAGKIIEVDATKGVLVSMGLEG